MSSTRVCSVMHISHKAHGESRLICHQIVPYVMRLRTNNWTDIDVRNSRCLHERKNVEEVNGTSFLGEGNKEDHFVRRFAGSARSSF